MRRKLIPEEEIINLSKSTIQSFYSRDIEHSINLLADDFMWIGAFDFQFATNKAQFLKIVASELDAPPFKMMDENFILVSKSSTTYVVCAKFKLIAQADDKSIIRTHTRLTIMWKYIHDELKLFHVHGSNSQDVPITVSNESNNVKHDEDFFSYLTSLNLKDSQNKITFRDISGKHRYFLESEIIYLQANLQNTFLYTANECIELSGILLENSKKLTDKFYRIHKSYIINTSLARALERYTVTLVNDIKLPISKEKFIPFREHYKKQ